MKNVIITGANSNSFHYLELFVRSLRGNGKYEGIIAVCDNSIEGTWDEPGTYREGASFSLAQMDFLKKNKVDCFVYSNLLEENGISRKTIEAIPSKTQRYPHKFFYTTLISKKYINEVNYICFFDADIYFQKPVQPLFDHFEQGKLYIVAEGGKIKNNYFLSKWINYSDFSSLSEQDAFLKKMRSAKNFCSGFFGGDAKTFHALVLLSTLLTTNQLVSFFSDQPTINILKTFFQYPIEEISNESVLHLGDLPKEEMEIDNHTLQYRNNIPIAVHFNGDTKDFFLRIEQSFNNPTNNIIYKAKSLTKLKARIIRHLRKLRTQLRLEWLKIR